MNIYEVSLDREAQKDLRRMGPGPERNRIREALARLAANDPPPDVKPIRGAPGWLRMRVGDYRLIYRAVPDDPKKLVVHRVIPRGELDKAIAALRKL